MCVILVVSALSVGVGGVWRIEAGSCGCVCCVCVCVLCVCVLFVCARVERVCDIIFFCSLCSFGWNVEE